MRHFVNRDKILEAYITEPYANSGESWDISSSKGWEVVLTMGYLQDGYPVRINIPLSSELECINKINELGLHALSQYQA